MSTSKTRWRIDARSTHAGTFTPPPSKSDAQRALVLERVLGISGWSGLTDLSAMPADVRALAGGLLVLDSGGPWPQTIDCGDGGAPYRFLLGQAAVTPDASVEFVGSARLGERPHGALVDSLRAGLGGAGLRVEEGNPWPTRVTGASRSAEPRFIIDGSASSQYVSSLVLAAAALAKREQRAWTVDVTGEQVSAGYLELTLEWLHRAGFVLERDGRALHVRAGTSRPAPARVPGDWSSSGYLLLLAWKTGGTVAGLELGAPHPDREILRVLAEAGLAVREEGEGVSVAGQPTNGVTVDGAVCPDLLPTVAVLACFLPGVSTLEHVGVLRAKESDRLEGVRALVAAAGGRVELDGERLRIHPPTRPAAALALSSMGDHRLAMCAATLAVLCSAELLLDGPECVEKSFPAFWREVEHAGVRIQRGA